LDVTFSVGQFSLFVRSASFSSYIMLWEPDWFFNILFSWG
jgi:hypothetical protein